MNVNTERQAKLQAALERILQTLITQYRPEKVILFGSVATGSVGEWSDLDLVIIKDTPLPFLQRLVEVAQLCYVGIGVHYLVYTPDEFARMVAENNPFIVEEVLHKGKVLYERQPVQAVA